MVQNAFTLKPSGVLGKELERNASQQRGRSRANQKSGMSKEEAITSFNKIQLDLGSYSEKPGLAKARI